MKLLFDQNISYRIVKKVTDHFPGCMHISGCGLNDAEDSEIWNFARINNFVIVTFDSDFFDLCLIRGLPPKVIWLRSGNLSTFDIVKLLIKNKVIITDFCNESEKSDDSCLELV